MKLTFHVYHYMGNDLIAFFEQVSVGVRKQLEDIKVQFKKMEDLIMAKFDDLKAQIADIGNDITEIDGDLQEVIDKLAGSPDGLTAAQVTDVMSDLAALKDRTRAAADKVPEPTPVPPPVTPPTV